MKFWGLDGIGYAVGYEHPIVRFIYNKDFNFA